MKKLIILLLFFNILLCNSQVTTQLIKRIDLTTDNFIGCDFDLNYYYFTNTILSKKTKENTKTYSNFLYGNISSVDITNPLKIVVFYREFNVIVLLDSQLNETDIIQIPYDINYVSKGAANHLWLFTRNTQIIENYNFKTNTVVSKSQPLKYTLVSNMKSTENYVYLQTEKGIEIYDYLGSYIKTYPSKNLSDFQISNRGVYTLLNDSISYIKDTITSIKFNEISKIEKFYTINNQFFIFEDSKLYLFSTNKK